MKLIKSVGCVLLAMGLLSFASSAGTLGRLKITVLDTKEKPLENVKITLTNRRSAATTMVLQTDKDGIASCIGLALDPHTAFLEKEGYNSVEVEIAIRATKTEKTVTMMTKEEAYKVAYENSPEYLALEKYNEAIKYVESEDYDNALSLLNEAVDLDNQNYEAYFQIGRIFFLKGKYDEAVAPLEESVVIKDDYVLALRLIATCYEKMDKKKEAEIYSKKADEAAGPTGIDKYNEAIKFINERDLDAAVPLLREAIRLAPDLAEAYYELGLALVSQGMEEEAIKNLEKYLEISPEGEKAPTARAVLDALRKSCPD